MENSEKKRIVALASKYERAGVSIQAFFDERSRVFVVGGKEYPGYVQEDAVKKERWFESKMGNGPGETPIILSTRESIPLGLRETFVGPAGDMLIQIAIDNGYLVRTREEAGGKPLARYVLLDENAEAKKTNRRAELVSKAMGILSTLSMSDKRDLCWALRKPVRTLNDVMVDSIVNSVALENPDQIIQSFANRNFKVIAFLQKLVGHNIIIQKAGQYRLGEEVIGIDEVAAVDFLSHKKNQTIVKQLTNQLDAASNGLKNAAGRVVKDEEESEADELPFEDEEKTVKA